MVGRFQNKPSKRWIERVWKFRFRPALTMTNTRRNQSTAPYPTIRTAVGDTGCDFETLCRLQRKSCTGDWCPCRVAARTRGSRNSCRQTSNTPSRHHCDHCKSRAVCLPQQTEQARKQEDQRHRSSLQFSLLRDRLSPQRCANSFIRIVHGDNVVRAYTLSCRSCRCRRVHGRAKIDFVVRRVRWCCKCWRRCLAVNAH